MSLKGKAFKYGAHIDTDAIIPARHLNLLEPADLAKHCMEDLDAEFISKVSNGDIIVADINFGCGSSREQAVSCLKGHELVIVANDFARIFLQNGINLGLRMIVCPGIEASEGDELELTATEVINKNSGKRFPVQPMPKSRQAIIDAGGLIQYTRKRLQEASAD